MSKSSARLKNKQAYLMYWVLVCALCVGVGACSDSALIQPEASDSGAASFVISSKVVAATLSRVEVVITGSNMDEIRQDLTIDEDTITGVVQNIPAGNELRFTLNGYDSSDNLVYSGSAMADVVAGEQVTVRITMKKQEDKIYWFNAGSDSIGFYRANLDGSKEEKILGFTCCFSLGGLVIDVSSRKMYWTYRSPGRPDRILRNNLDGSQIENLVIELSDPWGLALDVGGGKMYWVDDGTNKIQRANLLDGSQVEDLVSVVHHPRRLALDVGGGKMYWTEHSSRKIQRANLDGSQVEDLVSGLSRPEGLALDVGGGKMYWTDYRTHKIQRASLDGSEIEDLVVRQNKVENPTELILDVDDGKMYWIDQYRKSIRRANLDGSEIEDLVVWSDDASFSGLALDLGNRSQ